MPKQIWLDRIVRGRAWIPLLGFTLAAIVGLRVEVLKLSSGVGSQIQEASELQSSNATLRSSVSELSGNQRIELLAKTMGMVMPGPMDVHFVPVSAGTHLTAAVKAIHTPESDTFLSGLAAERDADETSVTKAVNTSAVGDLAAPAITDSTSSDASDTVSGASSAATDSSSGSADSTTDSTPDSTAGAPSTASDTGGSATGTDVPGSSDPSTTQASGNDAGAADSGITDGTDGTDSTDGPSDEATSGATTGSTTTGGSITGGSSLAG